MALRSGGLRICLYPDRARERVKPTLVGWISVETPWDFNDREQHWRSTALAWESGTGCSALFYGLEQSLQLLTDTGLSNIEQYTLGLSDQLCDGLGGKNYDSSAHAPLTKSPRSSASSIATVSHRARSPPNSKGKRSSSPRAATACGSQRTFTIILRMLDGC